MWEANSNVFFVNNFIVFSTKNVGFSMEFNKIIYTTLRIMNNNTNIINYDKYTILKATLLSLLYKPVKWDGKWYWETWY